MAAVLNSNRLIQRLAQFRTSSVESQRTLTHRSHSRIPIIPRVGADFKFRLSRIASYPNLRQKFRYKKPAGGVLDRRLHTKTIMMDELKTILSEEVPLCTGVIPLDSSNSQLFYRNAADGNLGYTPLIYSLS